MSRRHTLFLVQSSVSVMLIWYLLSKIDFSVALNDIKSVKLTLFLVGVAQLAIQPFLGALRWTLIVRILGGRLGFATALGFFWTGAFFSQALPGAVGGDVVRIWLHWRYGAGRRLAINGVALERLIMVLSVLILVAVMHPWFVARRGLWAATWLPSLILVVALGGLGILMLLDRLVQRYSQWLPLRVIADFAIDLRKVLLRPVIFISIALICILAYVNMGITAWLIALALGLTVSLPDCIVLIPVVVLATTIPISVGGWGVREGAMIVLFATTGMPSTDALALSVIFGIASILVSLPGLVVWLAAGYRRSDLASAASFASVKTPEG